MLLPHVSLWSPLRGMCERMAFVCMRPCGSLSPLPNQPHLEISVVYLPVTTSLPYRPSLRDVHTFLRSNCALIVHFSGDTSGSGTTKTPAFYPDDLLTVLKNAPNGDLCCSVITPTDDINGFDSPRRALGNIGLILRALSPDSILKVSPDDFGSSVTWKGDIGTRERDPLAITIRDLQRTLTDRTLHNQWDMTTFEVIGVLAVEPFGYRRKDPVLGVDIAYSSLQQIKATFPTLPLFTFCTGQLVEVGKSATTEELLLELYPDK